MARGTSLADITPRPLEHPVPWKGNRSHETYGLYCSRYAAALAPHPGGSGGSAPPPFPVGLGMPRPLQGVKALGWGKTAKNHPRDNGGGSGDCHQHPLSFQLPAPHPPCPGYLLRGEGGRAPAPLFPFPAWQTLGAGGLGRTRGRQRGRSAWADAARGTGQGCPCSSRGGGAAPHSGRAPALAAPTPWGWWQGWPTAPANSRCLSARR